MSAVRMYACSSSNGRTAHRMLRHNFQRPGRYQRLILLSPMAAPPPRKGYSQDRIMLDPQDVFLLFHFWYTFHFPEDKIINLRTFLFFQILFAITIYNV